MAQELRGALIIGQSGGPTSVINASAYGVIRTALDAECITKVYGAHYGIKGVLDDDLFVMDEEDKDELDKLMYTPSSALGSCRYKMKDPDVDDTDYKRILEIFQKFYIHEDLQRLCPTLTVLFYKYHFLLVILKIQSHYYAQKQQSLFFVL